ncbi:MAG: zinc-ribbon and DUF3426 domain-containing protein [Pseudomonadales bacterium]
MDDSLLTKCPHCQTLFRIHQEHLAAAGGEVRCGVCYKVFDAHDEGVAYSQGEGSPAEKTFANKPTEQQIDEEEINEELVINTSPEPEPDPLKILAEADIGLPDDASAPTQDDLGQINIGNSSITDIVSPAVTYNKRPALKWVGLSLIAMFALVGQWLTFNFEANAQQPQWHSLYVTACETLGCELPHYQQISAIKTDRLAIKTHPEYSNVLIIDMIISNSAQHSQPLPVLNMTFSTITGEALAQRLFQPEEYLGKHLKQLPLMPSKTPVHLSFAILDPGDKAVNYSVNFAPSS